MSAVYDTLAVIRPPRAEYEPEALGPAEFSYAGVSVVRHDVELVNKRGLRLCASLWQRRDAVGTHGWPACVYLHGNASCRTEATLVASEVLQRGAALFAFDFAGCGLSDGDYITLGHFEKDDVEAAVTWLRTVAGAGAVALWGRSMGATSALLHAARDGSLAGLICDSPFSSVEAVSLETWRRERRAILPSPLLRLAKLALAAVAHFVHKRTGFDMYKCRPACTAPLLIATATADTVVRPHHSEAIYAAYAAHRGLHFESRGAPGFGRRGGRRELVAPHSEKGELFTAIDRIS
ncbi:hypothetical protein EMIHUDRAFT_456875 [Emiliania huxleyi CCMP1516]|uniref:Serine aminopeptidase S33 domain-containing protein n=2 Tax=Emiliania huxleyi TaxID=2903 RepID=A0A0D3JZN6_EMIH1|nr:hypothetical protein EMIHUDRAFT_456875 [Emiliania huxleyi CCMP1516]EOD28971.1 hypothetical protein EMIHUDRAFT_456875 [Emiliania huxleyi CCMP1516]|eukprot:XP_005781400.1 hypothetical protein EMIHUDRAFT_456875 [Emiliania huxleyi CCMP1516]